MMLSLDSMAMPSTTSGSTCSRISFRPAAAVPQARTVASPGQQDCQTRRRATAKSAVAMDSAVLSCPWPRTLEHSSAVQPQGQGIIAGLKQVCPFSSVVRQQSVIIGLGLHSDLSLVVKQ